MKSIYKDFWHETRGRFDRLPVWLPGTSIALGDVGLAEPNGWVPLTSLRDLGIPFTAGPVGTAVDYAYNSSDGAEVSVGATIDGGLASTAPARGNAELRFRFCRAAAFALMASAVRVHRLNSIAEIDAKILMAYRRGSWPPRWTVVTEIAIGGPVIVVVSGSANCAASVDLGASMTDGTVNLARAGVGLGFGYQRNVAASFVSRDAAPVLWRGRYLRTRLLRSATIDNRGDVPTVTGPRDDNAVVRELEMPDDLELADR